MSRRNLKSGVLVVVELGAEWPAWVSELTGFRRVLTQEEGEAPEAFAARARRIERSLFPRAVAKKTLALLCNERTDAAAMTSRAAVVSHMLGGRDGAGQAFVAANARAGGRLRSALATAVTELAQSHGGRVAVRFESDRDASVLVQDVA
jgi:hypothetical protein